MNGRCYRWKIFFEYEFIFIIRSEIMDKSFIESVNSKLGISNYRVIELAKLTCGQAETAFLADKYIEDEDGIIVYNIDTYVKPGALCRSEIKDEIDGLIPVVIEEGDRWSFVRTDDSGNVVEVAEKRPISNYASIGFYYFKKWSDYKQIFFGSWKRD